MSTGPAQVSIGALIELRAMLASRARTFAPGPASGLPDQEVCHETPTPDTTRAGAGAREPLPAGGDAPGELGAGNLVQALADLLLEALGARTAPSPPEREIGDEPEDHR